MSASPEPVARAIPAEGLTLNALDWNPAGNPTLLLCHGWLDHAHGFDWVCAALPAAWRRVALDFRGHGQSGHLPPGFDYGIDDYLADVEATLDALGLPAVHLVGHSMGGAVSVTYAAARPERVRSLTFIESLGPLGGPAELLVPRLTDSLDQRKKPLLKRTYRSVEEAVVRVREGNSGLSEAAALHMARAGLRQTPEGYQFTFDPALRRRSAWTMSEDQVLAVLEAVRCPVQVIHGTHGYSLDDEQMQRRLARLRHPQIFAVEGGHHVHLDRPAEVASHIERMIASVEGAPRPA